MRRALRREPVDHLPTQMTYTGALGERLAAHLCVPVSKLAAQLGNHMLRVDLSTPRRLSDDGSIYYDWWGAGWSTGEEGYFLKDSPLSGSQTLTSFPWPDPDAAHLLHGAAEVIDDDRGQHFITPNLGFCLFERAWSLRGFDALLMDLALSPAFVEELLDRITAIQIRVAQRFVEIGVDGGYYGDDYGAQKGLLFSPRTWRTLFKPRLADMFNVFREADLPVIFHSDGQIDEIIPDLVEIGVTVLNPVQPEVLDHAWLKRTFGERLSFYGGISTQTVLPHGTPAQVRDAVRSCVGQLASDGTGLLLAPSHRMMTDIPLENIEALVEAFAEISGAQ